MAQSAGRLQDEHFRRRGEVRRPEAEHLAASGWLAGWLAAAPSKRKHQEMASSSASSTTEPERKIKRGKKERPVTKEFKTASQKNLTPAPNSTSIKEPSILKPRRKKTKKSNEWTINYSENTKLWMRKWRSSSYRPEDLEAFFRLLGSQQSHCWFSYGSQKDIFLATGRNKSPIERSICSGLSKGYLLSMVVEYFGHVGLPGHLYNRIHFFLALYIASEMEEADPTSQWIILQSLLGRENVDKLCKEFLNLRMEFFQAMEYRAWVTPELCEEIQAQDPQHWVWRRVRQCTS
ncbi:speedy protein E4-like [Suncus etruscus]|uniref:speedy protein E4-like n=1 Tax=Suncus etruscus TaxID=109475 RepID=UPI00210F7FE0|nr:speedy protein E4-like [Suncus etruscus]